MKRGGLGWIEAWLGGVVLAGLGMPSPPAMADPVIEPATGMTFVDIPAG